MDIQLLFDRGTQAGRAETAVRHDEARPAHALVELGRSELITLKYVFGMGGDAVRDARDPVSDQGDLRWDISVVGVQVPDVPHFADEAAGLTEPEQRAPDCARPRTTHQMPERVPIPAAMLEPNAHLGLRSEEHTSELQ